MPPSDYSDAQIENYLKFISLPEKYHPKAKPALNLEFLTALHVHQLATIPYENLLLHYSPSRVVSLDPQALYNKVTRNGRGGYCMEISVFFNHILRALGFQVYTAGVRIRMRIDGIPQGNYIGWVHIVNIVTLQPSGDKYMVDVAFGGDGATKPIPLIHGFITPNLGTQDIRLVHEPLEEFTDQSQRVWIYQYRNGPDKPWNSFYAFPEAEFLQSDFEIINYWASQCRESFQTTTVLLVKFVRKDNAIVGKVMMANEVIKENMGGKTIVLKTCKNEEERVNAFKTCFGITLTEEEIKSIHGHPSELRNVEMI